MAVTLLIISALVFFIIKLPPGDFLTNQIAELRAQGEAASAAKAEFLDQAIRARPSGLGAIPRLDRRVAGAERLLGPDPGRLGMVVRIRQAGQRGRRRRALADAARQSGGRDLRPRRLDPDRHLLGDAAVFGRRLHRDLHRLYRPRDAELPARADPALLHEPLVRRLDRRPLRSALTRASRGRGRRSSRSSRTSSCRRW